MWCTLQLFYLKQNEVRVDVKEMATILMKNVESNHFIDQVS